MVFDRVTFELRGDTSHTVDPEDLRAVVDSVANACRLREINRYLAKYDKHIDLSEDAQKVLDDIRNTVLEICED